MATDDKSQRNAQDLTGEERKLPPRDRDQSAESPERAHDVADRAEFSPTRGAPPRDLDDSLIARDNLEDEPDPPGLETAGLDERRRRIAEAAYYRAQRRGFDPGNEDGDWHEAEKEIDAGK